MYFFLIPTLATIILVNVFDMFSFPYLIPIFGTAFIGNYYPNPSVYGQKIFFYFLLQYINLPYIMSLEIPKTFKYI